MNPPQNTLAFGAPGIEPRWTSSAKEGVGTAYHTSCRAWFTLSHGIVNEIYYPHVDQPNTRDFQFLISDGETFCHEEKRDLNHEIEYPERDCLFYRLTNSELQGRYRLVKEILTDPHRSVLLVHTKLEVLDESLRGRLQLYALLAPHLGGFGAGNSGSCTEIGDNKLMHAVRQNVHLLMTSSSGFSRCSVGYVGFSDGWQDLMDNFKMDWQFRTASDGNIALTGEINLPDNGEFTIAVAFGRSYQSAATKLFQSLAEPIKRHRQAYVRQWQRAVVNPEFDFSKDTCDDGGMYRLSRCVLLAHEDKVFQGAIVASMSIPWGEAKGDLDLGGYHLVWTRDLVHSAMALLATGQTSTPLRALIWLAAIQRTDGSFPQNSWIDGTAYWFGLQLDQIAFPILLAWWLHKRSALGLFHPRATIVRAAARLILQAPVTTQDELVEGIRRHYIRITPTDANAPDPHADANTAMIQIANGGGLHPARNVVGGDFLHLVRFGIRDPNDAIVRDSIEVIDRVLKHELPQGPGWRRYNHDGYGQKDDGGAFDGTGVVRCWPILTGERGHYELAAGRDPKAFITAMEDFSNQGGMITEQIWDGPDLPSGHMKRGCPTGAAMPLCWSHAEYISLVRSRHDGVCLGCIEPAFQRYVLHPVQSNHEIWTLRYPMRRVSRGKILRMIVAAQATVVWSTDGGTRTNLLDTIHESRLNLWFADFPTADWPAGSVFTFTFFWKRDQRWEGRDWQVSVLSKEVS